MAGVRIPIKLDKEKASADAKEFSDELKSGMKDAEAFGLAAKEAFDALKESLSRLVEITKEVIQVAAEQEKQETRTFAALQLHTKYAEENMAVLAEQNEARRQWTAVSNAQQLQLEGTALQMGVEASHLKTVMDATINLSNATGKDLSASLVSVVKLYEGNTKALQRMGIEVSSVQEGFDKLTSLSTVTGANMATFSGHVDQLKSNFEELLVALGESIVKNDDVKKFLSEINEYLKQLIDEVLQNGPAFKARVSEIVGELRELGAWLKDHREDITEMVRLFSLAGKVKLAASVAEAGAKLAGGPAASTVGGIVGAGARFVGGSLMDAVGAGGVLGAATIVGGGALGGLGLMSLVPETHMDAVAEALKRDQGWRPEGEMEVHKGSGFKRSANLGTSSGWTATGDDAEMGTSFGKSEIEKDIKQREEAARKRKAIEDKEYNEYLKIVDMDLAAYHERNRQIERLEEEEVDAKAKWAKRGDALNVAKIQAFTVHQNELYRAHLNGFKTIDELHQAEIANGIKYAATQKAIDNERAHSTRQFWEEEVSTGAHGLATFVTNVTEGFRTGKENVAEAARQFLGAVLTQIGTALVSLGTAVELAAIFSLPAPISWGATGGPAGIAAGLGIIAAGGLLMGFGGAVAGSGASSAPSSVPPSAPSSAGSSFGPGFGGSSYGSGGYNGGALPGMGKSISIINVNIGGNGGFMVGNSAEVARYIADLLGGNSSLSLG